MIINELRIGNYIRHNVKDDETGGFTQPNEDKISQDDLFYFMSLDGQLEKAEAIDITIDWVKKFGFVNEYKKEEYSNDEYFLIKDALDVWEVYRDNDAREYITGIEYVHQLQNLYFALTGKEL